MTLHCVIWPMGWGLLTIALQGSHSLHDIQSDGEAQEDHVIQRARGWVSGPHLPHCTDFLNSHCSLSLLP